MSIEYNPYQTMSEGQFYSNIYNIRYDLEDEYKMQDIGESYGEGWREIKYVWILRAYTWSYVPNVYIRFKEVVKSFNREL